MEPENLKQSDGGYYYPHKCRADKDYLIKSAHRNNYRQKPKQKIYKKKVLPSYTIEEILSLKNDLRSLTEPTNKYLYRHLIKPNKELLSPWRNQPKLIKSELDSMTKTLKSLLNKLTPTNLDSIKEKISELFNQEISVIFSNLLLTKACMEVKYSETYSKISLDLMKAFPYFRNHLLQACQDIFQSQALEAEDINLNKRKMLGCVTFVGELLNTRIISGKVVTSCCEQLLKKNTEVAAEGVCYLISTCCSYFNSSKGKETGHGLINELKMRCQDFSSRLKFQVQDLEESRKIKAIMVKNDEKPRNVNEFKNNL